MTTPFHLLQTPEFRIFKEKRLAGNRITMSFMNNKTFELWNGFMKRRKDIVNQAGNDLYSVEVYPPGFFLNFNPGAEFEKYAAVEISGTGPLPDGMVEFTIPEGKYAVFTYKGSASEAAGFYGYIFNTWLPASGFRLDHRPHLAVMGEKYRKALLGK